MMSIYIIIVCNLLASSHTLSIDRPLRIIILVFKCRWPIMKSILLISLPSLSYFEHLINLILIVEETYISAIILSIFLFDTLMKSKNCDNIRRYVIQRVKIRDYMYTIYYIRSTLYVFSNAQLNVNHN